MEVRVLWYVQALLTFAAKAEVDGSDRYPARIGCQTTESGRGLYNCLERGCQVCPVVFTA